MKPKLSESPLKAAISVLEALGYPAIAISDLIASGAEEIGIYKPPAPTKASERLKRLDDAREALRESLEAIEEMEEEARVSEERRMTALAALQETLQSQESAEQKLANIKHLMAADMSTLREATTPDMKKERMIGIVTGVACSLIAAAIWVAGEHVITNWDAIVESIKGFMPSPR